MAYAALFTAIIIATIGDYFLKKSEGYRIKKYAVLNVLMYIPTFYLISVVMLEIPVGITYATWSGIGVLGTTLIGVYVFKEKINLKIVFALMITVTGVILMNLV